MVRETQELAQIRVGLEEVLCHFQELEDPREPINIKHSIESVVVIANMGILASAAGPTSIAEWAKSKSVFLIDLLSLEHGVPRKDVFRRVLTALKPAAFQKDLITGFKRSANAPSRPFRRSPRRNVRCFPWTARRRGGAMIGRGDWGRCTR